MNKQLQKDDMIVGENMLSQNKNPLQYCASQTPRNSSFQCMLSNWSESLAKMNDLSGEELKAVFQLCQPNAKGLISLAKLQNLLDQHTNQLNGEINSINHKVIQVDVHKYRLSINRIKKSQKMYKK
jgi:hypothetical protein